MKLTLVAREKLKNEETQMRIALTVGIGYSTLRRWIENNYEKGLTRLATIEAIKKHTGLKQSEIFE